MTSALPIRLYEAKQKKNRQGWCYRLRLSVNVSLRCRHFRVIWRAHLFANPDNCEFHRTSLMQRVALLRYHVPHGRHEPCVYHQSAWPQRARVALNRRSVAGFQYALERARDTRQQPDWYNIGTTRRSATMKPAWK